MFSPILAIFLLPVLEFATPILAAQKWGVRGFVRANLWIMIALTLASCILPKATIGQFVWFISPLGGLLVLFLLGLRGVLHLQPSDAWLMVYLTVIAPQLLFTLVGCLIWLAFRRPAA